MRPALVWVIRLQAAHTEQPIAYDLKTYRVPGASGEGAELVRATPGVSTVTGAVALAVIKAHVSVTGRLVST